ncbi:hypothetical protein GCM10011316_17650 [Roseibium aquae]|uniref:Histidine kinase/HSP90-like ATPase domain-containing protein n=1 Tax=Roseibium aquae TaxID=1323746 RepID=A0A916X009_9HYPH|nr:ATP-binding protein [Roseibium aquae]GGB45985.1 hypothetical protein GCM10011316_17650 [Roseibium aquae]
MQISSDQITVENKLDSLLALYAFIDQFAKRSGASDDLRRTISLVVEELFTNTVSYGYPHGTADQIRLEILLDTRHADVTLTDHGIAFDAGIAREVEFGTASAEQREIGGLGLFLVHQLADSVTNTRQTGTNVTHVRLPVPSRDTGAEAP